MRKWLMIQKLEKGVGFRVFMFYFQVIRFDGGEEVFISGEFNSLQKVMPFGEYNIPLTAGTLSSKMQGPC